MLKRTKLVNPFRLKRKKPKKIHKFLVDDDYGTKKHQRQIEKYFDKLEGNA